MPSCYEMRDPFWLGAETKSNSTQGKKKRIKVKKLPSIHGKTALAATQAHVHVSQSLTVRQNGAEGRQAWRLALSSPAVSNAKLLLAKSFDNIRLRDCYSAASILVWDCTQPSDRS